MIRAQIGGDCQNFSSLQQYNICDSIKNASWAIHDASLVPVVIQNILNTCTHNLLQCPDPLNAEYLYDDDNDNDDANGVLHEDSCHDDNDDEDDEEDDNDHDDCNTNNDIHDSYVLTTEATPQSDAY